MHVCGDLCGGGGGGGGVGVEDVNEGCEALGRECRLKAHAQ